MCEWGRLVRIDNRYETMYSRQPFIDGQGVQRVVIHDEPWPDLVNVIDRIIRTMPPEFRWPVWSKFVWRIPDQQAADEMGTSKKEYRETISRSIWYSIGRIDG